MSGATVHHPSCPRRTDPEAAATCFCPPVPVGEAVVVEGLPGRWRVMKADYGLVAIARAGAVQVLWDGDVALVRRAAS